MQYYKRSPSSWMPDTHKYTWKEISIGYLTMLIFGFVFVLLLKTCA